MTLPKSAYLGGPMRGYPRYNFDAFEEAYQGLTAMGIEVVSPHRIDLELGFNPDSDIVDKSFLDDCVRRDVDAIIRTEAVILLPGWEKSLGALAERAVADWLGRPCYTYEEICRR